MEYNSGRVYNYPYYNMNPRCASFSTQYTALSRPKQQAAPSAVNTNTATKSFTFCNLCEVYCIDAKQLAVHVCGAKHIRKLKNASSGGLVEAHGSLATTTVLKPIKSEGFSCDICGVSCTDNNMLAMHLAGSKHRRKQDQAKFKQLVEIKDPKVYCDICDLTLPEPAMILHKSGSKHKRKSSHNATDTAAADNNVQVKTETDTKKPSEPTPTNDLTFCSCCNVRFTTTKMGIMHYQSDWHSMMLSHSKQKFRCDRCMKVFINQASLNGHLSSLMHIARTNDEDPSVKDMLTKKRERMKLKRLKKREIANIAVESKNLLKDSTMVSDSTEETIEGDRKRKSSEISSCAVPNKKLKAGLTHCDFCNVDLSNQKSAVIHYQSNLHRQALIVSRTNPDIACDVCKKSFVSQVFYESHLNGFKHYSVVNRFNPNPEGEFAAKLLKQRESFAKVFESRKQKRAERMINKQKATVEPLSDVGQPQQVLVDPVSILCSPSTTDTAVAD